MPAVIAFCALEILVLSQIIRRYYEQNQTAARSAKALFLKGLPTFLAALLAFYGYSKNQDLFSGLLLCGLLTGTLADVLIEFSLPLGGIFFAIGHLFYACMFVFVYGITAAFWPMLICIVVLIGLLVIPLIKRIRPVWLLICCSAYGVLLCALFAMAVPHVFYSASWRVGLAAFGVVTFIASDLLLLRRNVLKLNHYKNHYLCLAVYYSAQLIFALSACLPV